MRWARSPVWLMASIPDGIAREDGNLTEIFLSDFGIDIEYSKRLDRQRPRLEGDFNGGSNNIVQSNKSV